MACCDGSNEFPNKYAAEEVTLTFDFSNNLSADDQIDDIKNVTVETLAGEDLNPSAMIGAAASVSDNGKAVLVPIVGGISGNAYQFLVLVSSGEREAIVLSGYIRIT